MLGRCALLCCTLLLGCATTHAATLQPTQPSPATAPDAGPATLPSEEPATGIAPGSPYFTPDVVSLRNEASTLVKTQAELLWDDWTAAKPLDVATTYEGHDRLFSAASVHSVQTVRAQTQGDAALALGYFETYLAGEVVARASAPLSDQIADIESHATLAKTGAPSYSKLDQLLAGEASADQRAKLYAAALPVIAKLDPLLLKRREAIESSLKDLGYPSFGAFVANLHGIDLADLAALAEQTLTATDDLYKTTMDRLALDELALPLARVRRSDLPRLFRSRLTDNAFPSAQALPAAQALFGGLGFDLTHEPALHVDSASSPRKNAEAICVPVVVPTDVRVSFKARPGAEAYREILFALALSQEDVHNTRAEWEFQLLGPNAASNAFATVFQDLVDSPAWLQDWKPVKAADAAGLARRAATLRLYLLRRYAGRLEFEALQDSGQLKEKPADAYRRILSRALGFKLTAADAKRYLTDQDEFLESADSFLAWLLAGQIEAHLTARYGARWWTDPKAGTELLTLWADGRRTSALDVTHWAGSDRIDPAALVNLLAGVLAPH